MADDDDRIWNKPTELIKILVTLAPDINVRVALLEIVEFIFSLSDGDTLDTDDLLEIVVESIAMLHHHVGMDGECEDDAAEDAPKDNFSGLGIDDIIERFRQQMEDKKNKGWDK